MSENVNLNKLKFCVFDLETTGGNHHKDGIIEIGLVLVDNLEIIFEKNFLVNPGIKIPDFIQKLTSISDKDVQNSPSIHHVIDEILEIMKDRILVAHNTSFDIPFFNSVLRRLSKPELHNKNICTNLMSRYLMPNLLNTNLPHMSNLFGIKHGNAHRALDDARATAKLLIIYLKVFIKKDIEKINHLYYPRNKYELDRINIKNNNNLDEVIEKINKIDTPFLAIAKGEEGVLEYIIPIDQLNTERDFLIEKLRSIQWTNRTIQYFGSFLEAYTQFMNYSIKTKYEKQKEFLQDIATMKKFSTEKVKEIHDKIVHQYRPTIESIAGSFVVTKHLVPHQLIIFDIENFSRKSSLIFRYPAHKKKLTQFINSRMSKGRKKKNFSAIEYLPLILHYVEKEKLKEHNKILTSPLDFNQQKINIFLDDLEIFLTTQKHSDAYPKQYV